MRSQISRLFVLSASARAHAQAAAHLHCPVIALDGFADEDLQADECRVVPLREGQFTAEIVRQVSERSQSGDRLIYGSGFEADPGLLTQLKRHVNVLGNSEEVLRQCTDARSLTSRCDVLQIPMPEMRHTAPESQSGWLVKRNRRSGGAHVHPADSYEGRDQEIYWQRYCEGDVHSALFLAGGTEAELIGVSRLLAAEEAATPYMWGGAIGSVELPPEALEQVQWIADNLTCDLGLLGLCGFDFVLTSDHRIFMLDLNPRLTATCELYQERFLHGYMQAHIQTCLDKNIARDVLVPDAGGVNGMRVVYAPQEVIISAHCQWPDAAADRPHAQTRVSKGNPLCTVHSRGSDADTVLAELEDLRADVLEKLSAHFDSAQLPQEVVHVAH